MPTRAASPSLRRPLGLAFLLVSLVLLVAEASPARANEPPVAGPDQDLQMDEDTTLSIQLPGADPDGDPLVAVITALSVDFAESLVVDSLGNPVTVGSVLVNRRLFYSPLANTFGVSSLVVTYRVNDGSEDSANTATIDVLVNPMNDLPVPTLPSVLPVDEDASLSFHMGGSDADSDIFFVFFPSFGAIDPDFGHLLWTGHNPPQDMSTTSGRSLIAQVGSSVSNGWPMLFTPNPDECNELAYNTFGYWFREGALPEQQGPPGQTTFEVRCVNDPPSWSGAFGTERFASLSTHLSADASPYTLPALTLQDIDGSNGLLGPDPGNVRITLTSGGSSGTLEVDEASFPGITFDTTSSSISFETTLSMVPAVLATVTYTPNAGTVDDSLTLLANDESSHQGCADPADGPSCPLLAGIHVDVTVGSGGTPPGGAMTLDPGSGGFIVVDTHADDDTVNANCTLREAIAASNDDVAVDACPAGSGDDVVVLETGTYPLTLGVIAITDNLTIVGAGDPLSFIDGQGATEIFDLFDPLVLTDVSVVGLDGDGDGIDTPVDGHLDGGDFVDESDASSTRFTDQHLGGTTFGEIVDDDAQAVTVSDLANPQGVLLTLAGSAGDTAEITACNTGVSVQLVHGESRSLTCDVTTASSFVSVTPPTPLVGQPATVTVRVVAVSVPSAGPVSGTVTVDDGAGASCVGTLAGNLASCQLTPTTAGTRDWTVTYAAQGLFTASTATQPHEVDVLDTVAPAVLAAAGPGGSPLADCAEVRTAVSELALTFGEPVDWADQVSSYRLLAAGPDADFSTSSCSAPQGDDVLLPLAGAVSDLDPSTPTVTLELASAAPAGLVRLLACPAITDLAGNPLDGDANGTGGDAFAVTSRAEPDNLFVNGHFDRCPVTLAPWLPVVSPPDDLVPSETEDADGSSLSGSAQVVAVDTEPITVAQCVDLPASLALLELSFAARLDSSQDASARLDAGCEFHDVAGCAGTGMATELSTAVLADAAGAWSDVEIPLHPPASAASALCMVAVTAKEPESFDAYLDRLSLLPPLFANGFESGDTSGWRSQADPP